MDIPQDLPERAQRALGESYELRALLGMGGFAEVYAAFDRRLKRDVAVKVLRTELVTSPAMLERFRWFTCYTTTFDPYRSETSRTACAANGRADAHVHRHTHTHAHAYLHRTHTYTQHELTQR